MGKHDSLAFSGAVSLNNFRADIGTSLGRWGLGRTSRNVILSQCSGPAVKWLNGSISLRGFVALSWSCLWHFYVLLVEKSNVKQHISQPHKEIWEQGKGVLHGKQKFRGEEFQSWGPWSWTHSTVGRGMKIGDVLVIKMKAVQKKNYWLGGNHTDCEEFEDEDECFGTEELVNRVPVLCIKHTGDRSRGLMWFSPADTSASVIVW